MLSNFFSKCIACISLLFLAVLGVLQLFYTSTVINSWHEIPYFQHNTMLVGIAFLLLVISLCLLLQLFEYIPSWTVLTVVLIIFISCSTYIALNATTNLQLSDPLFCWQAAEQFNNGNWQMLKPGGYVNVYPFQLGWITFLRIVRILHFNIRLMFLLNVLFQSISTFGIYSISNIIWGNQQITSLSVLVFGLFLPNVFNCLFVYGTIPGYTFFIWSIYFAITYLHNRKMHQLFCMVLFSAISYMLKPNFQVGILSIIIIYVIDILNKFSRHKIVPLMLLILIVPACNFSIGKYYSMDSGISISLAKTGVPRISYFTMGMQTNSEPTKNGWFNGYNVKVYQHYHYDHSLADKNSRKKLRSQINHFKRDPKQLIDIFENKLISTWTDPTFQTIWSAPQPNEKDQPRTKLMKRIYTPNEISRTDKYIHLICKTQVLAIMLGSIITSMYLLLPSKRVNKEEMILPLIYIIGGIVYHLLAETKSQYVLIYINTLIPIACFGIWYLNSQFRRFLKSKKVVKESEFNEKKG